MTLPKRFAINQDAPNEVKMWIVTMKDKMKTPEEKMEAHWQRISEELLKQRNRPNYRILSFQEHKKLEEEFERLKKIEDKANENT